MKAGHQQRYPVRSIWASIFIWFVLAVVVTVPIAIAAASPLLEWRQPIYVVAGFAGVVAMVLLLLQPLLVKGYLPGLQGIRGKRMHGWVGGGLLVAALLHVAALWITSPPDVVDALLFRSPTPFSVWGVLALWAVVAAALLATFRRRLHLRFIHWRLAHSALVVVVVVGSVVHAMLIEGTMGTVSKALLCFLALAATFRVIYVQRSWAFLTRRGR